MTARKKTRDNRLPMDNNGITSAIREINVRNRSVNRALGALAALAVAAAGMLAVSTTRASADSLLIESFTHSSVADAAAWEAGGSGGALDGWPGSACLTAGTDFTATPIPGCDNGDPDADGSGALELTPSVGGRAGFALYNEALPTSGGLDITFDQAQYGGSGADGLSFFLVNGTTDLTSPGVSGGGLGYTATTNGTPQPGVDNGLIGIGLDKWGNFSDPNSSGTGCADGTGIGSKGPGQTANRVVVRGPGNGTAGYCFLGTSGDLGNLLTGDGTRAGATVQVHVVIDPSTVADRHVTVSLNGTQEVQVPIPQALLDAPTFKFGFSGSTGSVTDNHDVWNLQINSVIPVTTTTSSITTSSTTTSSITTSSTTTSEPTTTSVPAEPTTRITGLDSQGCEATVSVDYVATGRYTVTLATAGGARIGSSDLDVTTPGIHQVEVEGEDLHGLGHGDPVTVTVTDADGVTLDSVTTQIADPQACAGKPGAPVVKPIAHTTAPADAVPGKPSYTG